MTDQHSRLPGTRRIGKLRRLLAASCLLACTIAHAGSVEGGPHVIWINLSALPGPIDQRIKAYLDSDAMACASEGAITFMRKNPAAITPDLVERAMLKRDPLALKTLRRLITIPFGDAHNGFDGVVVYTDQPSPRMLALTHDVKQIDLRKIASPTAAGVLEAAFCAIRPPIARAP